MDDDGGLGIRNWDYHEQPSKGNLGLRLMPSSAVDCNTKPLLSNGVFIRPHCIYQEPLVPVDSVRDGWIHQSSDHFRSFYTMPMSHQSHSPYSIPPEPPTVHNVQMLQLPEPPQTGDGKVLMAEETVVKNDPPLKKRRRGCLSKSPKQKKPKKVAAPSDEAPDGSVSHVKSGKKNTSMIINGIDFDVSRIPTPVCSCTGKPQPCYRWGVGGWQSACCTTNISMHPLPMSTKRQGVRIAGRKMSQGAFKKVLEKLAGEGYNLSNPIDLRTFWAKHGTNKFVTIK